MEQLELYFPETSQSVENSELFTYWPASNVPINPTISIDIDPKTKKCSIVAKNYLEFKSDNVCGEEFDYYIATKDGDRLVCRPAEIHRMLPQYDSVKIATREENHTPLSKKEQLDEMKEKFGSRKTQRDLASKRKYAIQFGENDAEDLPSVNANAEVKEEEATKEEIKPLSTVLPPRNPNAGNVREVYSLDDIINQDEESAIMEYEEQLLANMKSDYLKRLTEKFNENKKIRIAGIYADVLLRLIKLTMNEMRRNDPMPEVEGPIKELVFKRYTSLKKGPGKSLRYVITDLNKDQIYVYILLITIMLHDFKPIELSELQTNCKIPAVHIKKILELIGCYIEFMRNSTGANIKVARIRLPLNVYKELKMKNKRLRS